VQEAISSTEWHAPLPHPAPRTLLQFPKVWVCNFRKRWGVRLRHVTRLSELGDDVVREKICAFWQYCKYLLASSCRDAVWVNFDETPVWYAQHTSRTNVVQAALEQGAPVMVRGNTSRARKRVTVGLTISTDPDFARRVPVFVVCRNPRGTHRPNSAPWRDVVVPGRVALRFHKRAWMDEGHVLDYLELLVAAWDEHCPAPLDGSARPPLVLVWDSFRAHLTDAVKEACASAGIYMVVVPGGLTSLVQGLDTHLNKAFKGFCREYWRRASLLLDDPFGAALDNQEFLNMVAWAADAALGLKVPAGRGLCAGMDVGAASFLQNGLTNRVDGSQDGAIVIKHAKVDIGWRASLPCVRPHLPLALEAEADPGYGSEVSDEGGADAGAGEEGVMDRIIAKRDEDLDALESDPETPARGSLWASSSRGPGTRRSSRRIVPARPFSISEGSGASSSGAACLAASSRVAPRAWLSAGGAVAAGRPVQKRRRVGAAGGRGVPAAAAPALVPSSAPAGGAQVPHNDIPCVDGPSALSSAGQ
jgi:hypothetical protein